MADQFAAKVEAWVRETKERMTLVIRASAQDVIEEAQAPVAKGGNMPVDTGFLRNSLQSSLNGSTSLTGAESYVMVASRMVVGSVADFGWSANYARHVEYGARGRKGRFFVRNAAAQWQDIVDANTEWARGRI